MRHLNKYLGRGVIVFAILALFVLGSEHVIMAKVLPTLFRGVRPLGMGGAFTAVADDENALFYNPAGLSNISTFQIQIFNPLIEASSNAYDLYQDLTEEDLNDTSQAVTLLRKYVGEHEHLRAALFPNVGFNVAKAGVMIGGLGSVTVDAEIRNPVWPEVHIDIIGDAGLLLGVGLELPVTGLSAGLGIKYISRESLSEVYTATDIAADNFDDRLENDQKSGSGVSADIGAIYKLPFISSFDTSVAVVVQNVPEMDMDDAKDIETQVNAGLAIGKSFTGFSLVGALDYVDIGNNIGEDDDIAKRLNVGLEGKLPTILSARVGLNQGYFTGGITLEAWIFKLDLAMYTEEVGAYAGQRADERYVAQLIIGW